MKISQSKQNKIAMNACFKRSDINTCVQVALRATLILACGNKTLHICSWQIIECKVNWLSVYAIYSFEI